jgi:chromate transporter
VTREPWNTFLRSMARVGLNSFGGPVAQLGVMHQEAVDRRGWVTDAEFLQLVNFANMLPGPEALEVAIHLGWLRRGLLGGIVAGILFVWPGFVSLTLLGWIYTRYGHLAAVDAFLNGIRPIAVALIAFAVVRLSLRTLQGVAAVALMGSAFLAHFVFALPFPLLLAGCGLIGVSLRTLHDTGSSQRGQKVLVIAILAGALTLGALWQPSRKGVEPSTPTWTPSAPPSLRQVALVETKAALITFGGAYTALPYFHDQMVRRTGWLTDAQLADGLALGETTPGPLISVGIFFAYLAAGLAGALVGGCFLFLPPFVLVLTLGRYARRLASMPWASAFLWGVSAATIGLILSLSAQIAPRSLADGFAVVVAVLALVGLWRFAFNPLIAVLLGGCLGLLRLLG